MADDSLSIVLTNDLSEVPRVAERVEAFCRAWHIPGRIVHRFNLALEEALTNVITYAFSDGRPTRDRGADRVSRRRSDGDRERRRRAVRSARRSRRPTSTLPVEDRKVGGLGIHLLRSLMQAVEYRRADDRNFLTFRTPADPPAATE